MNISKEKFVSMMNSIETQYNKKKEYKINDYLCEELIENLIHEPLHILIELIKYLCFDTSVDSWIDYYIYELDYGKKYYDGCVTENDGMYINISNNENLYDFLYKNYLESRKKQNYKWIYKN